MALAGLPYYIRRLRSARLTDPYWRISSWSRHRRQKRLLQRDPDAYSIDRLCRHPEQWLQVDTGAGLIQSIKESVRGRLPAGWWQEEVFWRQFSSLYPLEAEEVVKKAELALDGKIILFQWKIVGEDGRISWSATFDPSHPGDDWPKVHFSDITFYFDPKRPERDVKWCWELNRFQHLLCLGGAWRITGDERFAAAARAQLDDWMHQVQYPFGVQWSSNLEVALRALAWARCHFLCMNSKSWSEDFTLRFLAGLYIHYTHVHSELSLDHARTNHLLGESAALAHLSILYPAFSGAERSLNRSLGILGWLVPELILPDGGYAEQATGYFRFISEFLLPLIDVAATNGIRLPEIIFSRLSAGLKFAKALSPTPTSIPMIGDGDNGLAIGWQISDYWDFSPLFASAATLLDDRCLIGGMDRCPAEAFLLVGVRGPALFEDQGRNLSETGGHECEPAAVRKPLLHFPAGGYQISSDGTFHLVFDGGPLGIYPGFGHGHADGLSFVLYYRNAPTIIDPGTFQYNGPVLWRDYFRSTLAHNTLSLDGRSQSESLGTFRWTRPLDIVLDPPKEGKDWRLLCGRIKWPGAIHHRFILHLIGQGIIVMDRIEGEGSREIDWSLHLDPSWDVKPSKGLGEGDDPAYTNSRTSMRRSLFAACSLGEELSIQLVQPSGSRCALLRGSESPIGGWYSRSYGLKEPCNTLRSSVAADLPVSFILTVKSQGEECTLPEDVPLDKLPGEIVNLMRLSQCA